MERLSRFDIVAFGEARMVVIESDLLPPDPAVVVIPLVQDYPAVKYLNPVIETEGGNFILATRLIGTVRRAGLKRIGTTKVQEDLVTRAVNILMFGV